MTSWPIKRWRSTFVTVIERVVKRRLKLGVVINKDVKKIKLTFLYSISVTKIIIVNFHHRKHSSDVTPHFELYLSCILLCYGPHHAPMINMTVAAFENSRPSKVHARWFSNKDRSRGEFIQQHFSFELLRTYTYNIAANISKRVGENL